MRLSNICQASAALALLVAIPGCSVMAAKVIIKHRKERNKTTATASVPASSQRVYEAELKSLQSRPGASIISSDPQTHTIEANVGGHRVHSMITPEGEGSSELNIVTHPLDPQQPSESPAVALEKDVLNLLGVDYSIEELE